MAFKDFLNHTCSIYHVKKNSGDLGYGIEDGNVFSYPEVPEEKDTDVPCHFHVKSGTYQIQQQEPQNEYSARVKLCLPVDTDIRVNDKVVSGVTGYSYIAEIPRRIRNHHLVVFVNRIGPVKEAL